MTTKKLQPIIIVALTVHVGLFVPAALMDAWTVALVMLLIAAVNITVGVVVGMYAGQSRSASELIRAHRELATAKAELAAQEATNVDLRKAHAKALERADDASKRAESHPASLRDAEARLSEVAP